MKRVIKRDEVLEFQDRGLGRGVDATNPTPWLNKRAIQVRKVFYEDIIGTEEGNLYQGFINEVESTRHFQTSLSASVPANQLVSLGIDSELSRSYSVSQKSVGRKIITRTISFRANFDRPSQEGEDDNFERRLSNWIVRESDVKKEEKRFREEQEMEGSTRVVQKPPNKKTEITIKGKEGSEKIFSPEECFELCYDFVSTFSVTHYVHSLELGASHYRVMSLEEYSTRFSNKAKLGVGQLADIALGNESSFRARKYRNQTTKVGRMKLIPDEEDDSIKQKMVNETIKKVVNDSIKQKAVKSSDDSTKDSTDSTVTLRIISKPQEAISAEEEVKRGTIGEAVVGVKLQPISSLVSNVKLRIQLQQALQKYIHDKQQVKCKWLQYIMYSSIHISITFYSWAILHCL